MFVDEKLTDHFVESGSRIALAIKEFLKTCLASRGTAVNKVFASCSWMCTLTDRVSHVTSSAGGWLLAKLLL